MTTRYSKHFERAFNFTRFFSELCGADVLNDDYRMSWVTWYVIHLLNAAIGFTIYTVYVGMVNENDWTLPLKCLCMFCTGIQGYAKLINAIQKQQQYRFIHKEIIGIYTVYEQRKNYHKLLKESISLVKTLLNILLAIVILVTLSIIGVPIFYNLVFNERIFIMPFFFPYVNYNTNFGYYLTSTFHVICVLFGGFGNFISDTWCFMFAAHIPLTKNILLAKFKELNELLEKDPLECVEIKNKLKDIFQWHQKYLVFSKTVKNLFFWVIFIQVAMEFVSIVCTIVCIFLNVWPAAPVFLFYSGVLFYFHCALGNLVEISNDDVIFMIYDCDWYKLNVSQQKMILIMLRESQQSDGMSIGGVAPLTLNTALQLTKTIYTFSMMLRNFLK
ncbi:odorant receptor 67d-like [Lucilia cuprina]|uniref:odorant receptor 67d-like n=1 Tax=Lucilia cuprina TaxID=7375 RepID=UPI001F05FE08|nr:odorant receptor 67d-like [Lucilia cuprina]